MEDELFILNGTPIHVACNHACELATELDKDVFFIFCGIKVVARPGLDPTSLRLWYKNEFNKGKQNADA